MQAKPTRRHTDPAPQQAAGGNTPGWSLGASEVGANDQTMPGRRKTKHAGKSFHQTNFPHKGRGQTADHFVISEDFRMRSTRVVSFQTSRAGFLGSKNPSIDEEEDLEEWTSIGADHVLVVIYVSVTPPEQ